MGIYNSSHYRVKPLMDYINEDDVKGVKVKIQKLLNLLEVQLGELGDIIEIAYDSIDNKKIEKLLMPPQEILKKAISKYNEKLSDKPSDTDLQRHKLINSDENKRKAKEEIDNNYSNYFTNPQSRNKDWFVLEGCTHPDIFIETDNYIIVIEGKWTEGEITNKVSHINGPRNQMVRHLQGALNYNIEKKLNKKVIGFYIVDEERSTPYKNELTIKYFKETILPAEAIKWERYKDTLSEYYYGFITWDDVLGAFPALSEKYEDESKIFNDNKVLLNQLNKKLVLLLDNLSNFENKRYDFKHNNNFIENSNNILSKILYAYTNKNNSKIEKLKNQLNKNLENKEIIRGFDLKHYDHIKFDYNGKKYTIDMSKEDIDSVLSKIIVEKVMLKTYTNTKEWLMKYLNALIENE